MKISITFNELNDLEETSAFDILMQLDFHETS